MSSTPVDKQCVVVFPVYKTLNEIEYSCFKQAVLMTNGYKKVFVAPSSFKLNDSYRDLIDLEIIRFPDSFFSGIEGYNRLMLSDIFYRSFSDYEYILIHQSDAYLFRPDLKHWCDMGYDYVGAPWFKPHKLKKTKLYNFIFKYLPFLSSPKATRRHSLYNNVGNGGLSLRKIDTFAKVLNIATPEVLSMYKENKETNYNEDVFWGVEAPQIYKGFRKPDWREALKFSFEEYPIVAYEKNNRELPFGCHAFEVHERDFWKQFISCL